MSVSAGPRGLFVWPAPARQRRRLALLSAVIDPFTHKRLAEAGLGPGARCLQVGAGDGAVAGWMAQQVGPHGQVVATDVDLSHAGGQRGVQWVQHDLATEPAEPLAVDGGFHIIYARLLLSQLPGRHPVVGRLAAMLAPGGALVVEEFDDRWSRHLAHTPDAEAYGLLADYCESMTAALEVSGKDTGWEVLLAMQRAHLSDVDRQMWSRAWRGREAGCLLLQDTIELPRLRQRLLAAGGIDVEGLLRLSQLLDDQRLVLDMHPVVSTIGRGTQPEVP